MSKQQTFINEIAPVICFYANKYGYKYPSAIIAQACCESGYGQSKLATNDYNYFGMKAGSSYKGNTATYKTKEEYQNGKLTTITAKFRSYNNMNEGVEGYFAFIMGYKRYANLKTASSAEQYINLLKEDGWATSSKYVNTLTNILNTHELKKYDGTAYRYDWNQSEALYNPEKTVSDIFIENTAYDIIAGKYGSGEQRRLNIGKYYEDIQAKVNEILKAR